MAKRSEAEENILMQAKPDRRLLAHVPDPEHIRKNSDRRGDLAESDDRSFFSRYAGQRYMGGFVVEARYSDVVTRHLKGECVDVSQTGILVRFDEDEYITIKPQETICTLRFSIPAGVLTEGMEKSYKIKATLVRYDEKTGAYGFVFEEPLYLYLQRSKDNYLFTISALFLALVTLFILFLRTESVLYFRFNKLLYLYSIVTAVYLLSRYLFGAFYKPVPIDPDFTPGVTIVIPCFNEEEWIRRTILSCIDQDYPVDKLDVIIVDDCSTDNSVSVINETVRQLYLKNKRFKTQERLQFFIQEQNAGKRSAMARGIVNSRHELVAFVDSDSFLEPDAIKHLVQPFFDPDVAGVSGRTDVANTYTNAFTKMQAVRYYIAFRILKAAEAFFDSVMCLSGPLSCYRKSVVLEVLDAWLNQSFMGQKATFGDDRSLTNMIVKNHRTYYQDTAVCSTIVPKDQKVFLKQQMRWKRSWLRESLAAGRFMWKKEPLMALSFYMGLVIPVAAPIIVVYNLIYVPLANRVFPTTFLLGILMMSLLMSFAQLLLRKSKIWLYGLWFCVYYEAILLWQMPWAWVTFWVSTWGTRATPEDIKRRERRKARRARRSAEKEKHRLEKEARAAQRAQEARP